ncbi:protein HEG homolog 1 isoform X2 [Xenopus laevis]|uniref:Protein HEG homolog 1 isoform X2 n=1 Tax=Xenopus laevis TaxID=8355 RepID=A0A8J0TSS4_XENLA|nr:protein HEG homolog 1 isoform X2 [Xenopus laevis]
MFPGLTLRAALLLSVLWAPVRPHTVWTSSTGTPPSVTPGPNLTRTDIASEPGGSVTWTPRGHWSQPEPETHKPTKQGATGTHRQSESSRTISQSELAESGSLNLPETHLPAGFKGSGTHMSWRQSANQLMAPASEPTWNKEPNNIPSRSGDVLESTDSFASPEPGTVNPKTAHMDQPEPQTESHIPSGSELDWTGQNYLHTDWERPSATEVVLKSVTKQHVRKRTPHTDTTLYRSSTLTRTLLSLTNPNGSGDITEIPNTYKTATEPRFLENQGGQVDTTRHDEGFATQYSGTPAWDNSNTTQDLHNSKVTLQDSGKTTWSGNWTQNTEIIPAPNSETSVQESNDVTKNSTITTQDPEITISGITALKSSNSDLLSTSRTQEPDNATMDLIITTQNVITASNSGTFSPGNYPLQTPSYGAPTFSSATSHHASYTSVTFTSIPVTAPHKTDVPTNNPSTFVSISNRPSASKLSLLQSEPSSSMLSPLAPFAVLISSPATHFISLSTKSSQPSSPDIFSSSPILSEQPSSSLSPSLSEISSATFSTTSYISLSPTSTLSASLPAPSSTTAGTEVTSMPLTTNQFSEFSTAAATLVTYLINQTIQPHRTITDSARTVFVGTDSREITNNPTVSVADNILVETSKPVDGSVSTMSTETLQTVSATSVETAAQSTDPAPSTTMSSDLLPPPIHHSTQELPHSDVHTTESSNFHFTQDDPNRQVLTSITTKMNPNIFTLAMDLRTSTVGTTKPQSSIDQATSPSHILTVKSSTTTTPKSPVFTFSRIISPAEKGGHCLSNPCQNGGHCVELGHNSYKCECPSGWQGEHCATDVDECLTDPCPTQISCINKRGSFSCHCPLGSFLEKETGCVLARTFLGHIKVPRNFLNGTMGRYREVQQIEEVIVHLLNKSFSGLSGYYQSDVTNSSDTNHILISVQNVFSLSSNVTKKDIKQSLQNYMRSCESALESSPGCHLMLHPQLYYIADGLCSVSPPECDRDTTECSDVTGVAICQCKPGYFKYTKMDHSCKACEDGFQRVNSSCVRCPFGLGGFNCSNPYQLITVIIAAAGGGLLLVLGIALTVTCCRKNKNDINKLIFKSGEFQMSPYAEYGKSPRSSDWGRETIEMQENGSTKNLLQMTDVYYSVSGAARPTEPRTG